LIELPDGNRSSCRQLVEKIRLAMARAGLEAGFFHSCDPGHLTDYGLFPLPGLAVDGELIGTGRVISVEMILPHLLLRTPAGSGHQS